jgi:hypothetical protein
MMTLTGVPINKIIKVKNNYNLQSLVGQIPIDINRDSIIFAVSEKDMAEDPRFSKFTKKDGSPAYLQPIPKRLDKLQPAITHGYIDTVPTTDFTVLGKPARSASELRSQYAKLNPQQRKSFIADLFGKYDDGVYNIMNNKLVSSGSLTEKQKSILKKLIVGMMKEDESKVKNMKKLADMALYKQRQAEEDDANEKLDSAEAQQDAAVSDEDKKRTDDAVKKAKDIVKRANLMSQAAKHQVQSI